MTKEQRQHFKQLKADDDIVIKPSDKRKGFVLMKSLHISKKYGRLLDDADMYEKLEVKSIERDKETRRFVEGHISDKLPKVLEKAILLSYRRISQFYGLPNYYKEGLPVRRALPGSHLLPRTKWNVTRAQSAVTLRAGAPHIHSARCRWGFPLVLPN